MERRLIADDQPDDSMAAFLKEDWLSLFDHERRPLGRGVVQCESDRSDEKNSAEIQMLSFYTILRLCSVDFSEGLSVLKNRVDGFFKQYPKGFIIIENILTLYKAYRAVLMGIYIHLAVQHGRGALVTTNPNMTAQTIMGLSHNWHIFHNNRFQKSKVSGVSSWQRVLVEGLYLTPKAIAQEILLQFGNPLAVFQAIMVKDPKLREILFIDCCFEEYCALNQNLLSAPFDSPPFSTPISEDLSNLTVPLNWSVKHHRNGESQVSETVKMPAMFLDRDIRDRMPKYAENFAFEIGLGPLPFGQIMIPPLFTFKVFDTGAMIDFFYHAEFNRSVEVLVQMAPVPFLIFETSVRDRRCEHFIRVRMAEFNCSIMTRHNINVFWSPDPEFTVALLQNIAILQEKHRKDNYSITPCLELNKKDWCVTQSDRLLLFQAFRGLGNEKHSTIRARYASNWDLVAGFLDSHPVKRGSKIIDFQGGVGDVLKRQMKLISDIKTVLTAQYRPFQ